MVGELGAWISCSAGEQVGHDVFVEDEPCQMRMGGIDDKLFAANQRRCTAGSVTALQWITE